MFCMLLKLRWYAAEQRKVIDQVCPHWPRRSNQSHRRSENDLESLASVPQAKSKSIEEERDESLSI